MSNGNLITNLGKQIIMNRVFTSVPTMLAPTLFQVGTGTTTPTSANTVLATPLGGTAAFIAGYPIIDETNNIVTIRCLIDTATDNGNSITEFGLFNNDGTKKLFSRAVYNVITKTAQVQIIYSEREVF